MTKQASLIPPGRSPRTQVDSIFRTVTNMDVALEVLTDIAGLRAYLNDREDHAALSARQRGATWEQIGTALGITRQAAQQRWGHITDPIDLIADRDPEGLPVPRSSKVWRLGSES